MVGDEIVEDTIIVPSPAALSQWRQIACGCAMRASWTDCQDAVALRDTALMRCLAL